MNALAQPHGSNIPVHAPEPVGAVPTIARTSRILGVIVASLGVVIVIMYAMSGIVSGFTGETPATTLPALLAFLGFVPLVLAIVFGHIGVRRSRALGVSTAIARSGLRLGYLSLLAVPVGAILGGVLAGILTALVA